jgi:hypothetical protein
VAALAVVAAVAIITWIVLDAAGIVGSVNKHGARVEHFTIKSNAIGRKLSGERRADTTSPRCHVRAALALSGGLRESSLSTRPAEARPRDSRAPRF